MVTVGRDFTRALARLRDSKLRVDIICNHVRENCSHLDPAALRAHLRKIVRDDAELKAVVGLRN